MLRSYPTRLAEADRRSVRSSCASASRSTSIAQCPQRHAFHCCTTLLFSGKQTLFHVAVTLWGRVNDRWGMSSRHEAYRQRRPAHRDRLDGEPLCWTHVHDAKLSVNPRRRPSRPPTGRRCASGRRWTRWRPTTSRRSACRWAAPQFWMNFSSPVVSTHPACP